MLDGGGQAPRTSTLVARVVTAARATKRHPLREVSAIQRDWRVAQVDLLKAAVGRTGARRPVLRPAGRRRRGQYPREESAVTALPRRAPTYSATVMGLENIG